MNTLTYRILTWMGNLVIATAVPVLGFFVGGFSITAKTGIAPKGFWWTTFPAVGGGIVGICSLAIMASMIAVVDMPKNAKVWVGFLGLLGLFATSVNLPLYMIAAANSSNIPTAIEWVFGAEVSVGLWTFISYMFWFISMDTGLAGVITVRMMADRNQSTSSYELDEFERPSSTNTQRQRAVGEVDRLVLEALSATDQTINMILADLSDSGHEYKRHHVSAAVDRLIAEGKLSKEKRGGREYWYSRIPEIQIPAVVEPIKGF